MDKANIGLVGLAVMGENLVLNMESNGFSVAVYNRTVSKVNDFTTGRGKGKNIIGCHSIEELISSLERPRKVMLMVKAGPPIDALIDQILPYLEDGDILIDGGNSHFRDTIRRLKKVEAHNCLYVGTGVSGGSEGALRGPALMPGGSPDAWTSLKAIFQRIAAKAPDGSPCCEWIGCGGAGHFVKMVHNAIEYADMQLICEAYFLMKRLLNYSAEQLREVFSRWNEGELSSYLIEITAAIFASKDEETGQPLVNLILDCAEQKGTGAWTAQTALEFGAAVPTLVEAVFARYLSSIKEERLRAEQLLSGPAIQPALPELVKAIKDALYAAKICSYAQGFALMRIVSEEFGWKLNLGQIVQIWRAGCIIRAEFLDHVKEAFDKEPDLPNLLLNPFFKSVVAERQAAWRRVVATAVRNGIPVPAFSSALAYYDSYRTGSLPANLLQAQRDYFGAHTFERVDKLGRFHAKWY